MNTYGDQTVGIKEGEKRDRRESMVGIVTVVSQVVSIFLAVGVLIWILDISIFFCIYLLSSHGIFTLRGLIPLAPV